jgi:hypothetical protein
MSKASPAKSGGPKAINIEEAEVEKTKILEVISPSAEVTVPKAQKDITTTPKRKRMVNVLDVLEKIKTSSSTPGKTAEASKRELKQNRLKLKLHKVMLRPKLGLQSPPRRNPWKSEKKKRKRNLQNKFCLKNVIPIPEASFEALDYIVRHASEKRLSAEEKREAQYYAQRLKYPKGALIFNDSGE